jgi:hypothetical protein
MLDDKAIAALLSSKVGIFRKRGEERRFRRRDAPLLQRDAVQQTDDALRT